MGKIKDTAKRNLSISKYIKKEHIFAGVVTGVTTVLVINGMASVGALPIQIADSLITPRRPEPEAVKVVRWWGPQKRILYRCKPNLSCESPSHVQFNSTINQLTTGDERYFLYAKVLGTKGLTQSTVIVKPGDVVQIRAVVVNDANFSGPGSIAQGTKFRLEIPTNSGKIMQVTGHVSAENSQPSEVWDSIYLRSNERFSVEYVSESATLEPSSSVPGGSQLSDSIVEEGALIGYQYPNGIFPGGEWNSATVQLNLYILPPRWSPPEEVTSVN